MKKSVLIKQYTLYGLLAITLSATVYYQYQDKQLLNATKIEKNFEKKDKLWINKKEQDDIVNANFNLKKDNTRVDIFHAYKKEVQSSLPEKKEQRKKNNMVNLSLPPPQLAVQNATPPIIPFKYLGKLWGDNEYQVFVSMNDRNLIIKEGDTIQQIYKVEKISPPTMVITYIPLQLEQVMQIGETN